jgi:hypothetical protein
MLWVANMTGIWRLGEPHVSESGIVSLPLEDLSVDDPLHVWSLTQQEFLALDPETMVRQIPLALRQQYEIDTLDLAKAIASKQREVEKPWKRIAADAREKVRLTGDKKVFIDEISPKVPEPQKYGSEAELFNQLLGYLVHNLVFTDGIPYIIITAWILVTWRIEDTDVVGYLYVTAPRGHGKTRLLETLEQVVYRPLMAAYATRAGLIRALDGTCATVLLDEGEHYINPMQRGNTELIAVLNSGNRRGSYTIMVADITETDADGTKRTVKKPIRLDTYSAKCIVSRKPIFDTLEDRSVQIVMPKADRKMPPLDKGTTETLRAQLAQYRADHLEKKQPLLDDSLPETGDARLDDTLQALYAVTPDEYRRAYVTLINREHEIRFNRMRESYEFSIMEALSEAVDATPADAELILTETVAEAYNRHHANKLTTTRAVGGALTRLGFRSTITREQVGGTGGKWITHRGYRLNKSDRTLLEELKERYGLTPPKPVSMKSIDSSLEMVYSPNSEEEKSTPSYTETIETIETDSPPETPKSDDSGQPRQPVDTPLARIGPLNSPATPGKGTTLRSLLNLEKAPESSFRVAMVHKTGPTGYFYAQFAATP